MKTVGIIAEFNPFHNGHAYIIEAAKKLTGAEYAIVAMSGSFTQRGIPGCMDKYDRVSSALLSGADLVLELPVSYASASAEAFSYGAVSLLNSLGIVDYLAFGSESGDMDALHGAASELIYPSEDYSEALKSALKDGLSFPSARAAALPGHSEVLASPNNILGIEYLKALMMLDSNIIPVTVQRKGHGYHDTALGELASAKAIREGAKNNSLEMLKGSVPSQVYDIMAARLNKSWPVYPEDFSQLIHYCLLSSTPEELSEYQDMNLDLAMRLLKHLPSYTDINSFILKLKTKELTYTRISRALLHIMLKLQDMTRDEAGKLLPCPYSRILGFRKNSDMLMRSLMSQSEIPLVNKAADAYRIMDENAYKYFEATVKADRIYSSIVMNKYGTRQKDGCLISPVIV